MHADRWRFPANAHAIPALRRALRRLFTTAGLDDELAYDLLLAACEAATNAVEHAQDPTEPFIDVHFEVAEGQVTITVQDYGRWRNGPATPLRGRGLAMMHVLADTTVDADREGTTVTMRSRSPDGLAPTHDAGPA